MAYEAGSEEAGRKPRIRPGDGVHFVWLSLMVSILQFRLRRCRQFAQSL